MKNYKNLIKRISSFVGLMFLLVFGCGDNSNENKNITIDSTIVAIKFAPQDTFRVRACLYDNDTLIVYDPSIILKIDTTGWGKN